MKRLIGLETEYAIRFSSNNQQRPDNRLLYELITKNISYFTRIIPGSSILKWKQYFTENGSAFCYESLPNHPDAGLLEFATPECESPLNLLLYQKAIDKLLYKTLKKINSNTNYSFSDSKISLIKNCKDHYDNIYGAQENYSAYLASGFDLFFYRFFLVIYLPLLSFYIIFIFTISFLVLFLQSIFLILFYFFYIQIKSLSSKGSFYNYEILLNSEQKPIVFFFEKISSKILTLTEIILSLPMIIPFILVLNFFTFSNYKKLLLSFFITRILITGSGSLSKNGKYYLSEKAIFTKRITRLSNFPADRCIYDPGNLMKLAYLSVLYIFKLETIYLKQIFKREQRFQIGMSDSCMSQESEFLKFSTTFILLNMIDEGFLKETPEIENPISVLKKINEFPNFFYYKIPIKNHKKLNIPKELNAIEIQKWYLNQVKEYIKEKKIVEPEYQMIIKLWEEILENLENNLEKLFGRIDWVTKKILMDEALKKEKKTAKNNFEEIDYKNFYFLLKIIDIKYHDLWDGYYIKLENENLTNKFFSEEEIENAIKNPPETKSGFAKIRSLLIKNMNPTYDNIKLSWDHIQMGDSSLSKIIHLKDYKKKKS